MKRFFLILIIILIHCFSISSQELSKPVEEFIADIFEQYSAETEETPDYEVFYEQLAALSKHPIVLNQSTREDLEKLPFLQAVQVENILYYIYRFGPLHSVYELQLIDGLDMTDISRMLPFVTTGESKTPKEVLRWNDIFKRGKNSIYFRYDADIEKKNGYLKAVDDGGYAGSPFYNSLKYRFRFSDRIQAGLTAEKDAGEPVFSKQNPVYDFYSGYLMIENSGKLKKLIVGDFRVGFGMGLVMQTGFGGGKSSYVLNVQPLQQGISKAGSTDEFHFFRGAGVTIQSDRVELTGFYSCKPIDADTTGGSFSSIYKTGLHRTLSEINKRNTLIQQNAGINITYSDKFLKTGLTVAYTQFSQNAEPDETFLHSAGFSGHTQFTAGWNYRFRIDRLNFFGETAINSNQSVATVNGWIFSPVSTVSLVMLYRYYPYNYNALYAGAFSESTTPINESGLYNGVEIYPFKHWKISAYTDSYRFPHARYSTAIPSTGWDALMQTEFTPQRNLAMSWRIKYEEGMKNQSDSNLVMPFISTYQKFSMRYQLRFSTGSFQLKTLLEGNVYGEEQRVYSHGISAFQDITYSFTKIPLKINVRFQIFDIADYNNRIYAYENDVLYAFSIPAVTITGSRFYTNIQWSVSPSLTLWLKAAQTTYADDRAFTGSGNEQSAGNRRTDIKLMLAYEF